VKVVCVRNFKSQGLQYELTYGKVYKAITFLVIEDGLIESKFVSDNMMLVVNDKGNSELYSKSAFITLQEWRINQIKKIINV
jgi:hypothetical protein